MVARRQQDRQVAQAEEVHFQEPGLFNVGTLPLRDGVFFAKSWIGTKSVSSRWRCGAACVVPHFNKC